MFVFQVQALGGEAVMEQIPLGLISHPQANRQPSAGDVASIWGPDPLRNSETQQLGQQVNGTSTSTSHATRNGNGGIVPPFLVVGDSVDAYDEIAAACGALGRFPGSQVMGVVRDFTGMDYTEK